MRPNIRTSAFLVRSLRQESRLVSHHAMRAGLAATILVLFLVGLLTVATRGGVGNSILWKVMSSCYWFVTLLGGVYFSTAIVEEKEEQTLPLLKMTGATGFSILLGKSIPRLTCVLLLLLVIMPFVILSVTLGGVEFRGVMTATLGILTYAVMFSQIGLFASVVSKDAQRAFSKTLFIWGFLEFLPFWSWMVGEGIWHWCEFKSIDGIETIVASVADESWWRRFGGAMYLKIIWFTAATEEVSLVRNLSQYLGGFTVQGIWRPQMTVHLCIAVMAFLLSWVLFEPFTSRVVAEGNSASGRKTRTSRRRSWNTAVVWKSWRHHAGGWPWLLMRLLGVPLLTTGLVWGIALGLGEKLDQEALYLVLMVSGVVIGIAHIAILFGRLFNSEIKEHTLSSLLMLPRSRHSIVGQTVLGIVPGILAAWTSFVIGFAGTLHRNWHRASNPMSIFEEIWFYQMIALAITSILLGLRLSIRLTYGGMLFGVVLCWLVGPICMALTMELFFTYTSRATANFFGDYVIPIGLFFVEVPLCVIWYFGIVQSLERTAERS